MTAIRSPDNAVLVCDMIADCYTLRQIARKLDCTSAAIVKWALDDPDGFGKQYAHAMDLRVDAFAEEIIEISDDGTNDWMERQIGDGETITVADHDHISRSKLRVDARKWLMSKMMPKKYGDKQEVAHTGPNGGPLETVSRIELVPVEPKRSGE